MEMNSIYDTLNENYIKFGRTIIQVIIDVKEKLWFKANDVATALGYIDIKDAIKVHVDALNKEQQRNITHKLNIKGHPQTLYIDEGGMYSLVLSSKMPAAKKFSKWITNEVLPSIRKYGYYQLKKDTEDEILILQKKINYIEQQYNKAKGELLKEKFPQGGVVYVIDYTDEDDDVYRIGMTGNMAKRKKIYDTHTIYKKNVVHMKEFDCPVKLETCVRAMLYDFRMKNNKDFYKCKLATIKKAFSKCIESIECVNQQKGGSFLENELHKLLNRERKLQHKVVSLNNILMFN